VDSGRAQLLIAAQLRDNTDYSIVLEFSEIPGGEDSEAEVACDHFVLAVRSWDTKKVCTGGDNLPRLDSIPTSILTDNKFQPATVVLEN